MPPFVNLQVLGDLLEAIAGAVYIDCGQCNATTWTVIEPLVSPIVTPGEVPVHPAVQLQELTGKYGLQMTYVRLNLEFHR